MTVRYRVAPVRPAANVVFLEEDATVLPDLTVFEPHDAWQETGLLTADGTPLQRRVGHGPLGFLAREDDA